MMRGMKMIVALGLLAAAALGVGCGSSGMGQYDVNVALDPALAGGALVPTIAVNIFGANATDAPRWEGENLSDYWKPDGQLRKEFAGMTKVFAFGPGQTQPQMLKANDPIWEVWKKRNATNLYIVANVPDATTNSEGRIVLPLAKDRWNSDQVIQIVLTRKAIRCDTPPLPVKP